MPGMTKDKLPLRDASLLVSAGRPEEPGEPLNQPIVTASNFVLGGADEYARDNGTPTWRGLESVLGDLEQGLALTFSSGMAAAAAVFELLPAEAKVAIPTDCYQGVVGLVAEREQRGLLKATRITPPDTQGWIEAAAYCDLLWLESPSNPLLLCTDIQAVCSAKRKSGGLVCVDNTFATALNQRPLELGADVSMHSATKFIGGHSDLLAGAVVTQSPEIFERMNMARVLTGATPGAIEAYLATRGVRTMALRVERAQTNAEQLALRLLEHPKVARVHYPGIKSHPSHDIARRQMKGFGAMLSFEVDGDASTADAVCEATQLIVHASSLGGVESTMERRAKTAGQEHLPATLLRLSVGIEDVEDLWHDLSTAIGQLG